MLASKITKYSLDWVFEGFASPTLQVYPNDVDVAVASLGFLDSNPLGCELIPWKYSPMILLVVSFERTCEP